LGSASDQCKCRWGKRRPFILALTITCICGLSLFPFTEHIADLLNGEHSGFVALLILTVLATTLTDFSVGAVSVPGRAFLLDVLPAEYTKFGNIICSIWISSGATVGFGIGAIDWSSNFSVQVKIVCGLSLIITVVCIVLTLVSFNEHNPPTEPNQVSITTIVNEDCTKATHQPTSSQSGHTNCGCSCVNDFISSVVGNLQFIRHMSSATIVLLFAQFFGFLAIYTQIFFFTDYVAEVVYNGDVTAPKNSTAYHDYTKGVKVGSLALGVSAISSLFISLLLGPIMKLFGMRFVFVFCYVFSMLQGGVMIFSHNVIVLFILSPAVYCILTILLTIPYILLSEYENKSILLRKPWPHADKNLIGRACSVLMIALLCSETVSLMINGPLKTLYGNAEPVMIITCASSFVGAVIACFVTIPYNDNEKNVDTHKTITESTESTKLLN